MQNKGRIESRHHDIRSTDIGDKSILITGNTESCRTAPSPLRGEGLGEGGSTKNLTTGVPITAPLSPRTF